ncbi:Unknown protein [Striga hermonthica]|uniref:Reverse transcriptase zinc-binding domain-containing protein n=1 Tax=Striga hermonthica TaxID=68872 RepID=A0A9N7MEW5_STRHE|nr:Unknown protein [Striga hermonthica]
MGHRALPTKELRHRRHLDMTGTCLICGDGMETWAHIFFECSWTSQVWARLVHCGFPYRLAYSIPRDSQVLEFIAQAPAVLRFALWFMWRERNNRVFGNNPNSPFGVAKEILAFFQWWQDTRRRANRFKVGASRVNLQKTVTWNPFHRTGIILHTDGSSMGNPGPSGFGAVLRNHEGEWIEGISGNIDTPTWCTPTNGLSRSAAATAGREDAHPATIVPSESHHNRPVGEPPPSSRWRAAAHGNKPQPFASDWHFTPAQDQPYPQPLLDLAAKGRRSPCCRSARHCLTRMMRRRRLRLSHSHVCPSRSRKTDNNHQRSDSKGWRRSNA